MGGPGWGRQPKPIRTDKSKSVTDELLKALDKRPIGKESGVYHVLEGVMEDAHDRRRHGAKKYGTELMSFNGRDCLMDAYEETHDLAVYTVQALMEEEDTRLRAVLSRTIDSLLMIKALLIKRDENGPDRKED